MKNSLALSLAGTLQGFFLSVYFIKNSHSKKSLLWLGLYIVFFSAGLLENHIPQNGNTAWQIVSAFISTSSYLYGPLLYLFVYFLTKPGAVFSKKMLLHFLPFAFTFAITVFFIVTGYGIDENTAGIAELIQFELLMIQVLTYNIMAVKLLDRYSKNILEYYSNIEEKDLTWLRLLLIIITGTYIVSFLLSHLLLFGVSQVKNLFAVVQLLIIICIYLMSYMVLFRPHLFALAQAPANDTASKEEVTAGEKETPVKYKKSGLKPEQAQQYLSMLKQLMETEKPFKDPDLSIVSLSIKLGISKSHLTQVINEQLGMNFFEFINMYRTSEAKKLLSGPAFSNLSIDGIAKEVGYKSRTTFFVNFKKITGLPPLEWLKSGKKD